MVLIQLIQVFVDFVLCAASYIALQQAADISEATIVYKLYHLTMSSLISSPTRIHRRVQSISTQQASRSTRHLQQIHRIANTNFKSSVHTLRNCTTRIRTNMVRRRTRTL